MLIVQIIGFALWVIYGFMQSEPPIIFTNMFAVTVNLLIIFLPSSINMRVRREDGTCKITPIQSQYDLLSLHSKIPSRC